MRTLPRLLLIAAAGGAAQAATRVYDAVYTAVAPNGVSTLADKNGPIGGNNPKGGTAGVLWLVESDTDVEGFAAAPHTSYIAYISQEYLAENRNAISRLISVEDGDKLAGVVIFDETPDALPSRAWSAGNTKPNAGMGGTEGWTLLQQPTNPNGGGYCTSGENAMVPCGDGEDAPTGLHWLNVGNRPIFLMTGQNATDVRNRVNNSRTEWPLTGMQLDFFQWTASNAEVCLRRSNCQVLGGQTSYGFLRPYAKGQKLVVVAATMDAVSLFHDLSYGASATGAGMVAAIAVADALRLKLDTTERDDLATNVLFVLFQGEEFGYIGSSALNDAIKKGIFPSQEQSVSEADITHYIEFGDVFTGEASGSETYQMWSQDDGSDIQTLLSAAGTNHISVPTNTSMPPCSMMGFLPNRTVLDNWNVVGNAVVLTAKSTTAGDYFQTRYDSGAYIGVNSTSTVDDAVVENLAKLADDVALAVLKTVDPSSVAIPSADRSLVLKMLQALEVEQTTPVGPGQWNVSMSTTVGGAVRAGISASNLKAGPMNRYVSVYSTSSTARKIVELWAGTLLSTALRVENEPTIYPNSVTTPPCTANGAWTVFARGYNATHMACFLTSGDGSVTALSPAFQKDSNNKISLVAPWVGLSTWTESTWDTGEIANYFSMPDPAQGDRVLAGGIVYFLGCLLAVWWANARVAVPKESYNVGEARNTYDSPSTPNEAFER